MRQKSLDDLLLAIFLMAALASLYMLYGQNLMTKDQSSQNVIASIVDPLNTVKRKRDFYQGWIDVDQGDVLAANDEVYTHGDSSTKISFHQGPQINLSENSLLKIKTINGQAALALQKGQLNAELNAKASQLKIELGNKSYQFSSPDAKIQIEQTNTENKFSVLDGAVKFNSGEKTLQVNTDQIIVEDKKTSSLEIKQLAFRQLSPADRSVFYFTTERSVQFKTKKLSAEASGKLIIARDSQFQEIVHEGDLEKNDLSIVLNDEGSYYWRIVDHQSLSGPARKFNLILEKPFLLNGDRSKVYQSQLQQKSVLLSWTASSPADNARTFQLEVITPDRKQQLLTLSGKNYTWPATHWGVTNFRIRAQEKERPEALWSEPLTIEVVEEKAVQIKSIGSDDVQLVNYGTWPYEHALEWSGPREDFTYKISVNSGKESSQSESALPSKTLLLNKAGTHTWSVQGQSPSGTPTNKISGKITVKQALAINRLPESGAVIELERPDQTVQFVWQKQPDSSYEFELADDQNFSSIILKDEIRTNQMTATIGRAGKYFWRVKVKGPGGLEYSRPVSVEIKPTPPLEAPEKVPDLNLKIKYRTPTTSRLEMLFNLFFSAAYAEDPLAVAEWDVPVNKRAKEYIVEIYSDQNRSQLIKRLVTTTPHIVWKEAVPGTFYWQVAYTDYWGRQTAFSALSRLIVENDPESEMNAFTIIELKSPSHRAEILTNRRDEMEFSWEDSLRKDFLFIVAADLEFSDVLLKRKVQGKQTILKCSDIKNIRGELYWKVISGKFSSKRRMITTECTEPPPPPIVPEPETTPEPAPIVESVIPASAESEIELLPVHYWQAGLAPQKMTYKNKAAAYEAKVDGQVINSLFISYHRPVSLWGFSSFSSGLNLRRGKVFNTLTFNDLDLQLSLLRGNSFQWGAVLQIMKSTLYVESGQAISDSSAMLPMLGIVGRAENKTFVGKILAAAGKGMHLEADLHYKINADSFMGPFFSHTSAEEQGGKHNFSQIGLKIGAHFSL